MTEKRKTFSPCSERDVRAAALKATHERLKQMDEKRQVTIGKFGEILKEESTKMRSYGEEMAKKDCYTLMTWETLKKEVEKFAVSCAVNQQLKCVRQSNRPKRMPGKNLQRVR